MTAGNRTSLYMAALSLVLALTQAAPAWARGSDIAPAPSRAPRTAVRQQVLSDSKAPAAPPRFVEGPAIAVDNERLRIGDVDLRLFGIVPPLLSSPFGPQTRSVLDSLVGTNTISCAIRDRERDGRLLASCKSAKNGDFALELLRRGLAVTARGSLRGSDLMMPYIAAEHAAQNQHLGLWSVKIPTAASESSMRDAAIAQIEKEAQQKEAAQNKTAKTDASADLVKETPKASAIEAKPLDTTAATTSLNPVALPATAFKPGAGTKLSDASRQQIPALADALQAEIASAVSSTDTAASSDSSFFSKYQFLISSLVLALAGLGITWGRVFATAYARRTSHRDLADALIGELQATRATYIQRIAQLAAGASATGWPRPRSVVFQAYANRLGLLGPTLSRQIGSIYGQAADYAAYFNVQSGAETSGPRTDPAAKKLALETLVSYIDAVLPQLESRKPRRAKRSHAKRTLGAFLPRGEGLRNVALKTQKMASHGGQHLGMGLLFLAAGLYHGLSALRRAMIALWAKKMVSVPLAIPFQAVKPIEKSTPSIEDAPQLKAETEHASSSDQDVGLPFATPQQNTTPDVPALSSFTLPLPSIAPQFVDLDLASHHAAASDEAATPAQDLVTAPSPLSETPDVEPPREKGEDTVSPSPTKAEPVVQTAPVETVRPSANATKANEAKSPVPPRSRATPTPAPTKTKAKTTAASSRVKTFAKVADKSGASDKSKAQASEASPQIKKKLATGGVAEEDGLWGKLRHLTRVNDGLPSRKGSRNSFQDMDDEFYTTYGGLTRDEIEALAFGESPEDNDDIFNIQPEQVVSRGKRRAR